MRAVKPRLLGAIGAAVIMLVPALATGPAQASSTDTALQASRVVHVFQNPHWGGLDSWLYTNADNRCTYVGSAWNDKIRSARTDSSRRVELWEHANCTGTSIVVDRTGYGNIGPWVSAIRS